MAQTILDLATQYPWILTVLAAIGILRVAFKPLCAIAQAVVDVTVTTKDNEVWAKIRGHWAFKGFEKILDLVASIKIPKKK